MQIRSCTTSECSVFFVLPEWEHILLFFGVIPSYKVLILNLKHSKPNGFYYLPRCISFLMQLYKIREAYKRITWQVKGRNIPVNKIGEYKNLSILFTGILRAPRIGPGSQQELHKTCGLSRAWQIFFCKDTDNSLGFQRHTVVLPLWGGKQPLMICKQTVWLCANKTIKQTSRGQTAVFQPLA